MYGDSPALSSDPTLIFPSNSKPKQEVALTEQQIFFMESDSNTNYTDYRQQFLSGNQNNSGILRYRSAPTSLLSNFANGAEKSEILSSRFCSDEANSMHLLENDESRGDIKGGVSRFSGMNSQLPPQYPRQNGAQMGYKVVGSMGSSLMRQNSSPAGLFSHLTSQNGIGSYKLVDGGANGGDLSPSTSRLKNHMNFSSGIPSMLSRITEVENENGGATGLDEANVENRGGENLFSSSGFPFGSLLDSSHFAENFRTGIKREMDNDQNLFVNNQNGELGNRPHILSHHLSLPKTSAEIPAMDKLLQLQDTVPCKVRAKRGCATHPRSIAERVRRTRISERMKKLQELVPNMEKQTNTADMLDLAVEYIKSLQKQYKTLSDNCANCKCSASQKVVNLNQTN
ncbi:hypothetical protein CDL12_14166 [Handroanthus impetiginosus]|uniref:BHLH domain-containing protein n=1 Tax=Handroanthus impetiginosus TaxID=429701 RepID=A0A2G9H6R1_9LAMI|nr:hypothetical protein CDL12_14166 [Handroanthus impetiginosus]